MTHVQCLRVSSIQCYPAGMLPSAWCKSQTASCFIARNVQCVSRLAKRSGTVLHSSAGLVAATARSAKNTVVKICGITTEEDAELAALAGANLLGMIMWQRGKRAVSAATARGITAVAHRHGAQVLLVPWSRLQKSTLVRGSCSTLHVCAVDRCSPQ